MKSLSSTFTLGLVILFAATGFTVDSLAAQDRAEAVVAFNNARDLAESRDFDNAIQSYRAALDIARAPSCEDCGDIVERLEDQLPRVYFQRAATVFQSFQSGRAIADGEQAIEYFREAAEAGEEFNMAQVTNQSRQVIPQLYYLMGVTQYNEESYDGALNYLDQAIEMNPNYAAALYQKGLTHNRMGSGIDTVLEWFDNAIEVGQQTGDNQTVDRAQRRAGGELVYQAVQRIDEERYVDALRVLERAENYTPNSVDMNYRFAEVYNSRGNYSQAIERANRALEGEAGGVADRAKIYFELGIAYQGLDQVVNACEAYANSAYGDFRDPALYEMEHELECEGM